MTKLRSLEAHVYRYPIALPVRSSFGAMLNRPAVYVRAEDEDGLVGWGEVWCNFPNVAAEYRGRLVEQLVAPMLLGRELADPASECRRLTDGLAVLAIQSGEAGPIAQVIAGIDAALWDLAARRAGEPLWCFLGGESPEIRTYASGINPKEPEREAEAAWEAGQRAFKLKIGFDADLDRRNIDSLRSMLGPDIHLAVDSNQAWSVERACALAPTLDEYGLAWLEEPLRADRPIEEWRAVAECTRTPLAGGENLRSDESFGAALRAGILAVFQPDVAKWGGITGCLDVAKAALGAGRVYCPHFLGGGIGLHASAHLLAAAGGPGLLEVDINDNKLRELVTPGFPVIADGRIHLSDAPGLGCEPDLEALAPYRVGF